MKIEMLPVLFLVLAAVIHTGIAETNCLPDIKRFSKSTNIRHWHQAKYYECQNPGDEPTLKTCPSNQVYWVEGAKCVSEAARKTYEQSTVINRFDLYTSSNRAFSSVNHAIGTPFREVNLKSHSVTKPSAELLKEINAHNLFETNNVVFEGSTAVEKLKGMGLSDQRMLDILLEMQAVSSPLLYFLDTSTLRPAPSQDEVVVSLRFQFTTLKKTMVVNDKTKKLINNLQYHCENQEVSHIVTGNYFGDFGYLEFRRKLQKGDNRNLITKTMMRIVKSLYDPSIVMTASMKKLAGTMTATFFGYDGHSVVSNKDVGGLEGAKKKYKAKKDYLKKHPNSTYIIAVDLVRMTTFCSNAKVRVIKPNKEIMKFIKEIPAQTNSAKRDIEAFNQELEDWRAAYGKPEFFPKFLAAMQSESKEYLSGRWGMVYDLSNLGGKFQDIGVGEVSEYDLLNWMADDRNIQNFYRHFDQHVQYMKNRRQEFDTIKQLMGDFGAAGEVGSNFLEYPARYDQDFLMLELHVIYIKRNRGSDMINNFRSQKRTSILQQDSTQWFYDPQQVEILRKAVQRFRKIAEVNTKAGGKVRKNFLIAFNKNFESDGRARAKLTIRDPTNKYQYLPFTLPTVPLMRSTGPGYVNLAVEKPPTGDYVNNGGDFFIKYWKQSENEGNGATLDGPYKFKTSGQTKLKVLNLKNKTAYLFRIQYDTTRYGLVFSEATQPISTQ